MSKVEFKLCDILYMDSDYESMLDDIEDILKKHLPDADIEIETFSIDKDEDYVGEDDDEELDDDIFDDMNNPVDRSGNSRYYVTFKIMIEADGVEFKLKAIKSELLELTFPAGKIED